MQKGKRSKQKLKSILKETLIKICNFMDFKQINMLIGAKCYIIYRGAKLN